MPLNKPAERQAALLKRISKLDISSKGFPFCQALILEPIR